MFCVWKLPVIAKAFASNPNVPAVVGNVKVASAEIELGALSVILFVPLSVPSKNSIWPPLVVLFWTCNPLKGSFGSIIVGLIFNLVVPCVCNNILFVKVIQSKILDDFVEDNYETRFKISNNVLFKNFMRKVLNTYLDEG